MTIEKNDIDRIIGQDVHTSDGDTIGSVGQVFLDDESGRPEWVTVKTGLFGTKESFVPLEQAQLTDSGLQVAHAADTIKDAPREETDEGHLSRDQERELYEHYGLRRGEARPDTAQTEVSDADRGRSTRGVGQVDPADRGTVDDGDDRNDAQGTTDTAADDRSSGTDEAMTRSEEQLKVGTQTQETGRARLRKYVVTEEQTVTVPVRREQVTLEREPITEENRGDAEAGPEISEAEHEVVLREERPVVDKETVPVERVRLDKQTVADEEQVSDTVRKEQIDTEGVDNP